MRKAVSNQTMKTKNWNDLNVMAYFIDPPKILRSPSPVVKLEKEVVVISCGFEGKPLPTVQWYVNDTKLVTNRRLVANQLGDVRNARSLLTIKNLNRADEGLYKCVVSNNVKPNVASSEALLTIKCKFFSCKPSRFKTILKK